MRQVWWMCNGDHVGCVDGHVCNTQTKLHALMTAVKKLHAKRSPSCRSRTFTLAARKSSLVAGIGTAMFSIEE